MKPWMQRRETRRMLVIVTALLWALVVSPFPRSLNGAGMPLTLALLAADIALGITTGWLAFGRTALLDERQASLRDRAYRIAFRLVALSVIIMIVVGFIGAATTDHSGPEPASVLGSRWIVALLELLIAMPTAVIAWLQPESVDDPGPSAGVRSALPRWLPLLAVPALAALWLLAIGTLPVRGSAVRDDALHQGSVANATCGHFSGSREVGYGFGAQVRLDVETCWDGTHAWAFRQDFMADLTRCSVEAGTADFARVTKQTCTEQHDANGTMHYTQRATVVSGMGDAVTRDVRIELDVSKDGKVLVFG